MNDEMKAIRASARKFDLDYDPNAEIEQYMDAANGDQDVTDPEDLGEVEGMPLDAAVKIVEISRDETFQFFCEIQDQLMAKYVAESKKFNVSEDHRSLHSHLAMGIEQVRLLWGDRIAAATERLQRATTEERRQLSATVTQILAESPRTEERASDEPLIVQGHVVNTLSGMNVVAAEFVPRRSE